VIVPGFIVSRIYIKGSLHREGEGFYSFAFKNTLAKGRASLVGPDRIQVQSSFGDIEFTTLPSLYVDDKFIHLKDAKLKISDVELPRYDEAKISKGVGESVSFEKGEHFIINIRGDLADGVHAFKLIVFSSQFGEIIMNFSDCLGESHRRSLWQRIKALFIKSISNSDSAKQAAPVKETRLFILRDKRPDPDFNRLLTTFKHIEPDRVPLLELTADEEVKIAFLKRPINSMSDEIEFWLALGYDYVPLWVINVTPRKLMVIDSHKTTYKEGLQERAWVVENEGAILTPDDLGSIEWPKIDDSLFVSFEEIGKFLPPEMKAIGCTSCIFETVTQAMGLQAFCLSLYDQPQLIDALFEKAGVLLDECIERMMQFDWVGAIWITDDLAYHQGPIISPKMLRKYVFPWYKRYVQKVHAKGLPILLHSCGNIHPLFEDLVEIGFDVLHPFEANSVDIFEAKRKIGSRICLAGNLDLSYMLTRASSEEIIEDVKNHIRRLAPGGGYCLGSSNSIPNYVPLNNFIAMNRACIEFGKYPISI